MQQTTPWTEEQIRAELRRCAREIEAMENQEPPGRAVLVTLGIEDWKSEMRLIAEQVSPEAWPYRLVSPLQWPDRVGWPCRVDAATEKIACVTFPDLMTVVVSWGALQFRNAVVQ
jgi:hypothetical protein